MSKFIISIIISVFFIPGLVGADDGSFAIGDFGRNSSRPTSEMSENMIYILCGVRENLERIDIFANTDKRGGVKLNRKLAEERVRSIRRLLRQIVPADLLPDEKIILHPLTYAKDGVDSRSAAIIIKTKPSAIAPAEASVLLIEAVSKAISLFARQSAINEIVDRLDRLERTVASLAMPVVAPREARLPVVVKERNSLRENDAFLILASLLILSFLGNCYLLRKTNGPGEKGRKVSAKSPIEDIPFGLQENNPLREGMIREVFHVEEHILLVTSQKVLGGRIKTLSSSNGYSVLTVPESVWRDQVQLMLARFNNSVEKDPSGVVICYKVLLDEVIKGNVTRLSRSDFGRFMEYSVKEKGR